MDKSAGLQNHSKQVQIPVALLHSLSEKYSWERYEPPCSPRYRLNSTGAVLLGGWLWHQITVIMYIPLNKKIRSSFLGGNKSDTEQQSGCIR